MDIRELEKEDYHKGFLDLVNHFTRYPEKKTYEEFQKLFVKDENSIVIVIEKNDTIIATGKILIEKKYHNNFVNMGHIEDIIVHEDYRKQGYGKMIINKLIDIGKTKKCYKIVLNVNEDRKDFYKFLGFKEKGIEMCLYTFQ